MDDLEYKQMREREDAVVNRLNRDLGVDQKKLQLQTLRNRALRSLNDAELNMVEYARALEDGNERDIAFDSLRKLMLVAPAWKM